MTCQYPRPAPAEAFEAVLGAAFLDCGRQLAPVSACFMALLAEAI